MPTPTEKLKLGWTPPEKEVDRSGDLFTHFTAIAKPDVPKAGEAVSLDLTWPKGASVGQGGYLSTSWKKCM